MLQKLHTHTKAQALTSLLLLAHDQGQGEVDFESGNGVCVDETQTSGGAGQLLFELAKGLLEALAWRGGGGGACGGIV